MKTYLSMKALAAAAVIFTLGSAASSLQAQTTVTYIGPTSGDNSWGLGSNWTGGVVPSSVAFNATVNSGTVNLPFPGATISNFTLRGGITGSTLIVAGGTTIGAAAVAGNNQLHCNGGLNFEGSATLNNINSLNNGDGTTGAAAIWDLGILSFINSSAVRNSANSIWYANAGLYDSVSGSNIFRNNGEFNKETSGLLTIEPTFDQVASGTLNVNDGELQLLGGGNHSGVTNVKGTLVIGNANTINGGSTVPRNATANSQGIGTLTLGGAHVFNAGSTFAVEAAATLNVSSGTTIVDAAYSHTATATVASGATLTLGGTGTHTGNINNSGTLNFNTNGRIITSTATIGGTGTINFQSGTTTIQPAARTFAGPVNFQTGSATLEGGGSFSGAGAMTFSGATVTTTSGTVTIDKPLNMSAGTWSGTGGGTVAVTNLFNFSGGSLSGSGTINASGGVNFTTSANHKLLHNGRVLTLSGANSTWTSGHIFMEVNNPTINNQTTLTALSNDTLGSNGGSGTFNNSGNFIKNGGTGTTTIHGSVTFNNTGTVTIQTGTLEIQGGGTNAGTINIASGSFVTFKSGNRTLGAGTALGGTGGVRFDGAIITIPNTFNISSPLIISNELEMSAGVWNGTGAVELNGLFKFSNGEITDAGIINAKGGVNFSTANPKILRNGRVLNLMNTASTWTAGQIVLRGAAIFNNHAMLSTNFDGTFGANGESGTFNNHGTFKKEGTSGTTTMNGSVAFNNTGTVEAKTGTILFEQVYNQTAGALLLNGGVVSRGNSTNVFSIKGGQIMGNGTITGTVTTSGGTGATIAPGVGSGTGVLTVTGDLTLSSNSTVEVDLAGTTVGSQYDRISEGGSTALARNGTLAVRVSPAFRASILASHSFTIITSNVPVTGQFTNVVGGRVTAADGSGSFLVQSSGNNIELTDFRKSEIDVTVGSSTAVADGGSVDFGTAQVGGRRRQTFTVSNLGDFDLILQAPTIDGANAAQFTVSTPLGTTAVAPGASTTFVVTFRPNAIGALTAALHLANNDGDENPYDVTLTGTGGTAPEAIAAKGQPVPGAGVLGSGIPAGAKWASFGIPSIAGDTIAFEGFWSSPAPTGAGHGIFLDDGFSTVLQVAKGQTATGEDGLPMAGVTWLALGDPLIDGSGTRGAFIGTLTGSGVTTTTNSGLWSFDENGTSLIAREGSTLDGLAGAIIKSIAGVSLPHQASGASTHVFFTTKLTTGTGSPATTTANDTALFSAEIETGALTLLVREGMTDDFGAGPRTVKTIESVVGAASSMGSQRSFDAAGVPVRLTFTTGPVTRQIFLAKGNDLEPGPAVGDTPATLPGAKFSDVGLAAYSTNSAPAFMGTLVSGLGGVTAANRTGIFQNGAHVVRRLDNAPGTPFQFGTFQPPVALSPSRCAFVATLAAPAPLTVPATTNTGIWRQDASGAIALVAREGSTAPDASGATFKGFENMASASPGSGESGLIFTAKLNLANTALDRGLWAVNNTGTVVKLLQEGDALGSSTIKTFTALGTVASSNEQGRAYSTKDASTQNHVVVRIVTADTSQAIYRLVIP